MNGVLTVRDKTTQQIITQPVFIPLIILKVNEGSPQIIPNTNTNLRINDVGPTLQPNSSTTKNKLLPHKKLIKNDHDYCVINNLSCLTNHPLLGNAKKPNRNFSLKPTESGINDTDTVNKCNKSNIDEEIIISDSEDDIQSPGKLKSPSTRKNYIRKERIKGLLKPRINEQLKIELEKEKKKKREEKKLASLTCDTCNEIFTSKEDLQYHFHIHPPFICENCGRGFVKRESFNAHRITHNDPNTFICEACGKGCKDAASLRVHFQIHENKISKCRLCEETFISKGKLTYHIKKVHRERPSFQCSYCGKLFTNQQGHNMHVRIIHFKVMPHECNVCHRKFGRRDYLKNHKCCSTRQPRMIRHYNGTLTREKRLEWINRTIKDNGEAVPCKFCGKAFRTIVAMRQHLLTHVQRYSCQFCPLTFSTKALSRRHEKIHEDGKMIRCDVCWKRFESKEMLDEHSLCHTNARYTCETCGKMFNRLYLMNHHRLMNHIDISDNDKVKKIVTDSLLEVSEGQSVNEYL